jgi:hypothetical protein
MPSGNREETKGFLKENNEEVNGKSNEKFRK